MRAVAAVLLLSAAGIAQAEEEKESPLPQQMEEVVVIGYDWSFDERKGALMMGRSEERRVGKECRSGWWAYH